VVLTLADPCRREFEPAAIATCAQASFSVLGRPTENVEDVFVLGKVLGRGQFGVIKLATHKLSGERYACKVISKRHLITESQIQDVRREVSIMHHVSGHPSIVSIYGAFEDRKNVYMVMELCEGGELFDMILEKGHFSESIAATIIRTVLEVVDRFHSYGVIHRDLKPENFLLKDKNDECSIRAIDFGLSTYYMPGKTYSEVVGSAFYVAPEVLRRNYSNKCDIWSAGIMLYILLSGSPPFHGASEKAIFKDILKGEVRFCFPPWPDMSAEAKEVVKLMLTQDPHKRPSAQDLLQHPWIRKGGTAPTDPIQPYVLKHLRQFANENRFKRLALKMAAESMTAEEISGLDVLFSQLDVDKSGSITFQELKDGLRQWNVKMEDGELREIMNSVDVDGDGKLDYREFITATLHRHQLAKEEHILDVFLRLDFNGDGRLTMDEVQLALEGEYGVDVKDDIKEVFVELDLDGDGRIDYEEFLAMMRKGHVDLKKTNSLPTRGSKVRLPRSSAELDSYMVLEKRRSRGEDDIPRLQTSRTEPRNH